MLSRRMAAIRRRVRSEGNKRDRSGGNKGKASRISRDKRMFFIVSAGPPCSGVLGLDYGP